MGKQFPPMEGCVKKKTSNLFIVEDIIEKVEKTWRKRNVMKIKKIGSLEVKACCLGEKSELERELIESGKIRKSGEDSYEVFTLESGTVKGQNARQGDYVKLDSQENPYPVKPDTFHANHRLNKYGRYEQIPKVLSAWEYGRPACNELVFILDNGMLQLNPKDPEHYFRANLWNTELTAPRDAVLVFYCVKETDGLITDVDFNFVVREEFLRSYSIVGE
jgi:hypothetical protein